MQDNEVSEWWDNIRQGAFPKARVRRVSDDFFTVEVDEATLLDCEADVLISDRLDRCDNE